MEAEWTFLNALKAGDQPFETVDGILKDNDPCISPQDTLDIAFGLYKSGCIKIILCPVSLMGKNFEEKEIEPECSAGILGDLARYFEEYCRDRKPLWSCGCGEAVPFGIWFSLTSEGIRREKAGHE